ncbi:hypothetical protein DL96DRAFT_1703409 [Flagelloscypha sp. PMI_526]|nr:hypothetical protein DL96DRAFT_1703409 [Flagelloscypha sp. PMI_526]
MVGGIAASAAHDNSHRLRGTARVLGPQFLHLPLLTFGLFGIGVFWAAEMSQASPYLLSLGVSKSAMTVVLMAGPMSGLIVQPIIGILSDKCTSRWGRRAPYMMIGLGLACASMLLMGYTRHVAGIFTSWGTDTHTHLTTICGILSLWMVDFSINAVQAMDRALIVDTLPISLQPQGNAWAAKMGGLGSVVGTFISAVDMTDSLQFLGSKQLSKISCIVSFILFFSHFAVFFSVEEKVLLKATHGNPSKAVHRELLEIFQNILTLPKTIKQICLIQLFAWIGWFPVLFYSTTYIGDLFINKHSTASPEIEEQATRLGSQSLFHQSVAALIANFALPLIIWDPAGREASMKAGSPSFLDKIQIPERFQIHLSLLWSLSHGVFFLCMMFTFVTNSVWGVSTLIAATGVSWAVTLWAPYSLLGEAILAESEDDASSIMLDDARTLRQSISDERRGFLNKEPDEEDGDESDSDSDVESNAGMDPNDRRMNIMGNSLARGSGLDVNGLDDGFVHQPKGPGLSAKAGIILGIHNMFIVIPQFMVTAMSTVIFAITDSGSTTDPVVAAVSSPEVVSREEPIIGAGSNVAYVFRIGGFSTAIAFFISWRLSKVLRRY